MAWLVLGNSSSSSSSSSNSCMARAVLMGMVCGSWLELVSRKFVSLRRRKTPICCSWFFWWNACDIFKLCFIYGCWCTIEDLLLHITIQYILFTRQLDSYSRLGKSSSTPKLANSTKVEPMKAIPLSVALAIRCFWSPAHS
jgi:hypothetical protein